MKNIVSFANIYGFVAIFASIYTLISYFQTGVAMSPYVTPWICVLMILFVMNKRILRKEISINRFLTINAVAGLLYILVAEIWLSNVEGLWARVFAAVIIAITVGVATENAWLGTQTNQILLQLEIAVVMLGIMLFFEETKVIVDSRGKIYLMVAVIVDLIALICSRTEGEELGAFEVASEGKLGNTDVVRQEQRWKGFIMLSIIIGILMVAGVLFVMACSGGGREILQMLVHQGAGCLIFLIVSGSNLFIRLFMILPGYESSGSTILPEPVETGGGTVEQIEVQTPQILIFLLGTVVICAVIGLAIYILRKFAHVKLGKIKPVKEQESMSKKRTPLMSILKEFLKKTCAQLIFKWKIMTHPNSPEALLLKAENLGKRYHLPRKLTESPGVYMRRLAQDEKIVEKGMGEKLLDQAEKIEKYFYRR